MTDPLDAGSSSATGSLPQSSTAVGGGSAAQSASVRADELSAAPPAAPTPGTAPGLDEHGKVERSRVSGVWIGLIAAAVFLVLLITFIAQNSRRATVHFLWFDGRFSIGLTILLSAVIGMLLVALPGSVRIVQLRRALRKNAPAGAATRSRGRKR